MTLYGWLTVRRRVLECRREGRAFMQDASEVLDPAAGQ
jgi:hypothetical protein